MNALRRIPAVGALLAAPRWAPAASAFSAATTMTATPSPSSSATSRPTPLLPCARWLHSSTPLPSAAPRPPPPAPIPRVPAPIPLVPDVATFLTVIGRNMKQHASKFPTWEALFTLSSPQLRELGVEPPRDRRYLLTWCQRFREGRFGAGGDFAHVRDGVAELRVRSEEDPADPLVVHKKVVNVAPAADAELEQVEKETAGKAEKAEKVVRGYKVVGARHIAGPYALPLPANAGARVTVVEGMWEHKRGRKIDGGERRRGEVRFQRKVAERRAQREQLGN